MNVWLTDIILFSIGLIVGFINTLAGGGSVLIFGFLVYLGLPIHSVIGTGRLSFLAQGFFSVAGFKSKGVFLYPFNLYLGISAMFGAILGAWASLQIPDTSMKKIVAVVMLFIGVLIFIQSGIKQTDLAEKIKGKHLLGSLIIFFIVGLYGGFVQVGTGFIVIIALMLYNRLNITQANSIKGLVILIFTVPALLFYAYDNKVDWKLGLILGLGTAIGSWITSRWSVGINEKYIRYFMVLMVVFIAFKLWFFD